MHSSALGECVADSVTAILVMCSMLGETSKHSEEVYLCKISMVCI